MRIMNHRHGWPFAIALVGATLLGCNLDPTLVDPNQPPANTGGDPDSGVPAPPAAADDALPDFAVEDVNAASSQFGKLVSPRDYLGEVSAWYFGHST